MVLFSLGLQVAWAEEEEDKVFSMKLSVEGGTYQPAGSDLYPYSYSRLRVASHQDLLSGLSYGLEGAALWQTSGIEMPPPEGETADENWIPVGYDNGDASFYSLELDRAFLRFTSGPLDVSGGLLKPNWGSSHFYRPTDYFNPTQPLQWLSEGIQGSEGFDANCFLMDDLSLEGAVRWMDQGQAEWVARLVNKGIGIAITPSFASLTGRNGMGLELAGTFPDFQLRVEGVDWIQPNGVVQFEWIAGFSTLRQGMSYSIELYRDETGRVLGDLSAGTVNATYLFMTMKKEFPGEWRVEPSLVKGIEGGPFLFWPKASWEFTPSWELALQGQLKIGTVPGPLALVPNRLGLSVSYSL